MISNPNEPILVSNAVNQDDFDHFRAILIFTNHTSKTKLSKIDPT